MGRKTKARHKTVSFHYKFILSNGFAKTFNIQLDDDTLGLISKKRRSYPEWTRLSYHQCPNCPLKESLHPRCPIAVNLADVVDYFKDFISHEEVEIEVTTEARRYTKRTSLQDGIGSLIGIHMVTSGCPVMDKLRPMVKTHLPFATGEETMYRVFSMYLLAQYLLYRRGQKPDWELKGLVDVYDNVRTANKTFCQRLSGIYIQDAILNAVVGLDSFAYLLDISFRAKNLVRLERLFQSYLDSDSTPAK